MSNLPLHVPPGAKGGVDMRVQRGWMALLVTDSSPGCQGWGCCWGWVVDMGAEGLGPPVFQSAAHMCFLSPNSGLLTHQVGFLQWM